MYSKAWASSWLSRLRRWHRNVSGSILDSTRYFYQYQLTRTVSVCSLLAHGVGQDTKKRLPPNWYCLLPLLLFILLHDQLKNRILNSLKHTFKNYPRFCLFWENKRNKLEFCPSQLFLCNSSSDLPTVLHFPFHWNGIDLHCSCDIFRRDWIC